MSDELVVPWFIYDWMSRKLDEESLRRDPFAERLVFYGPRGPVYLKPDSTRCQTCHGTGRVTG